jgi:hypothetical protein
MWLRCGRLKGGGENCLGIYYRGAKIICLWLVWMAECSHRLDIRYTRTTRYSYQACQVPTEPYLQKNLDL